MKSSEVSRMQRLENLSFEQRLWLAAHLSDVEPDGTPAAGARLAAYISPVAGTDEATLPESIRQHLKEKLPDYMQPAAICILPSLPHTPNGKLDRAALPDPLARRSSAGPASLTGEQETRVAQLWESLLGMEGVTREDNFFELGGHSLLVTRLLAQLNQWWGMEIPVRVFFQEPTIAGLLRWKDSAGAQPDAASERETFTF